MTSLLSWITPEAFATIAVSVGGLVVSWCVWITAKAFRHGQELALGAEKFDHIMCGLNDLKKSVARIDEHILDERSRH
jgi:hypothetical protein